MPFHDECLLRIFLIFIPDNSLLMNEYLSNYSVVSIYSFQDDQQNFIAAQSLIKNKILLTSSHNYANFENTLFTIETEGNNMEFSTPIEYEQSVYLRHKISRKYLAISVDEEEEREIRYKIVLGSEKHYFKITPCYQYQTKISTRIKFNEEVYLKAEYAASREGVLMVEGRELLLGFNQGTKLQLHLYSLFEKEEKSYKHGQVVWLSHIESDNFLSVGAVNNKEEVVFEPIHYERQIQNLKALWTIHSNNLTASSDIKFQEELRFKNLYNGQFLTFSRNYRLVDNQRIYHIFLDEAGSDFSKFILKPIKQMDRREANKGTYMSLLHAESGLFVGCRRERAGEFYKLLTFPLMDDEDLFRINGFGAEEEQALRMIFMIRQEFKDIAAAITAAPNGLPSQQMREIFQTYGNVLHELSSLRKLEKLYEFVRNQLGSSIRFIADNLLFFRQQKASGNTERIKTKAMKTLELSYKILQLFCVGHEGNQRICHSFLKNYLGDVGAGMGAEQLLMETFRDCKDLLPLLRVSPSPNYPNLISGILQEFQLKNPDRRTVIYWTRLLQLVELLNVLMFDRGSPLDINQFLISDELFVAGQYAKVFPALRVQGERIMVDSSGDGELEEIEKIGDQRVARGVEAVFGLFTNLTSNHSISSKTHIHNYLAKHNHACLTTFIAYLNRPLSKQLYSTLLNFIANCYIDSAPRLRRQKPLSFFFFSFEEEMTNVEAEEAYYSDRLRQMFMLRAEESRVCKPLHYSNTISVGNINQPSLTEQQLVSFRLSLTEAILNSNSCSKQQLETVGLLMQLDCYTVNEMLQLYEEFKLKLSAGEVERALVPRLLSFFEQLLVLSQELDIKKLKIYLKHKFQLKEDLSEKEYKYVLPLGPRAPLPFVHSNKPNDLQNPTQINEPDATHRSLISKNYIVDYNELRDTLDLMHASEQLRASLMQYFCGEQATKVADGEYLSSVFSLLVRSHLPKYEFLRLLTRCTILTHEEVEEFDRYFDLSKKLQYLVLVSENWLVNNHNPECGSLFLEIMRNLTDFLFDGKPSAETLQVKKQLMMGNLGVHRPVFELLQKNVYLLRVSKKKLNKKHKEVFQVCFQFIYWLIRQCSENKRTIYEYFSVLLPYQRCLEVGQTRAFTEFYRDEKDFAKEISFTVVEGLIERIIHAPSSERKYEECEYNPEYIDVLIVLIEALDIENKFFIEKLYRLIIRPDIFHRLLFLKEPREGEPKQRLCLKLYRIRLDPIQIPIIYHLRLLKLFRLIFQNSSEVIRNSLKLKLSQVLEVEYLLEFLAEPDIFSNLGIGPQLNFLLKEEAIFFLLILLEKTDAHSQIYESDALSALIEFYARVFLQKVERREVVSESESLFIPYIELYNDYLNNYQQNRTIYFIEHVQPLLQRFVTIFERQPNRAGSNRLRERLFSVAEALKQSTQGVTIKRATTHGHHGLKDIKLKWRNFVDDDEDNSKEEKFAKKTLLDILKSKPAKQQIQAELEHFYRAIGKRSKQYVTSTLKLLTMLFASKDISDGRKKEGKVAEQALKYFSGYIEYCGEKEALTIVQQLQKHDFIEVLLKLTTQKEFQLSKIHLKNIFTHCLRILNFLLARDSAFRAHRLLLSRFGDRQYGNKFLQFLKEGALEIISAADSQNYHEQINSALLSMQLCADEPAVRLFEESFLTLTLLCKHEPFTDYLRMQQSQFGDIDFLDKIYNMLTFLFTAKDLATHISISSVKAAEYILDFVSSMLTGRNTANQNYIIDNKYAHFVHQVLKLEKLQTPIRQPAREELLNKIVEFYHSNGIEIADLLQSKIKLIDFRQQYLLNRFKYILVKTLLECLIGNSATETKVKLELPVEIIKLNLIWVYELYRKYGSQYLEKSILHIRDDWSSLVERLEEHQKHGQEGERASINTKEAKIVHTDDLFLRLGFFYYQLIQIQREGEGEGEGEAAQAEERVMSEQKEKQRIVRKFFYSIREGTRESESEQLLVNQHLNDQMRRYYHTYYNAIDFFRGKTSTIEVSLKGQILRTYFPRLPLAEAITEQMKEDFQNNAVRISRDEKIKSLLEWEENFYEDIKGEDDFFGEIERSMPTFGPILRVLKHESEFLFIGWLSSFIICLAYLIQNYQEPSFDFTGEFFKYIGISAEKPIHNFMLLLCVINLLIGLLIGFYLFTRKIPLRRRLLELKLAKLRAQGEELNGFVFVWGNILRESIYNLYMIIFLSLTIVHPFFSAFPLIDAINRIAMGRFIIRSLNQTWSQLLVTVGLLVVFNVLYVQLAYEFFTSAPVYGQICKDESTCMYMFNDQNLKAGQGLFGVVISDYNNMVLNLQVVYEIMYIILSLKVIFEIFSGTIIDKFSELREQEESIAEDQNKVCYICAMERFDLDLEYEGFEEHTEVNHNAIHYIEYLFYLRRCQPSDYGIIERFITDCKQRQSEEWIPELDSLYKQKKAQQEQEEKEKMDVKDRLMQFCKEKISEVKKMHQKVQIMLKDLNKDAKDDRQHKQPNQKANQ